MRWRAAHGLLFAVVVCAWGSERVKTPDAGGGNRSVYYVCGNASVNLRRAAYEFDAADLRQDTARENLFLFGFALGKRYGITPRGRLKIGGIFNFGSVVDATLPPPADAYVTKEWFFHAGFDPELQFALSPEGALRPFVFAGGGVDFVRLRNGFAEAADTRQAVEFLDEDKMPVVTEKRWCPHAHGGVGFDVMPRREVGVSVKYSFRFWRPVAYDDRRDLPLESVAYREYFLTHMLQVQVLFAFEE